MAPLLVPCFLWRGIFGSGTKAERDTLRRFGRKSKFAGSLQKSSERGVFWLQLTGCLSSPTYHSFPQLLADGALDNKKTRALTLFFNEAETINRLLDQATKIFYQPNAYESTEGQENDCSLADFGDLSPELEASLEKRGYQLHSAYLFLPPAEIPLKQWREFLRTLLKVRRLLDELYPPARDAVAPISDRQWK